MGKQKDLPERIMAYASYLKSERLEKAGRYSEKNQKIIMFLVDFNMYPEFEGPVHETITVFRENTTKEFSRMHKYYVVELNKMDKTKCSEGTYKWLAFLNQNKEVLKEMSKDKCIQKAAMALIREGIDNTFISKVTKSSVREIEKLRHIELKTVH